MNRAGLAFCALLLTTLIGCVRTYHVEQSSVVNAGISSDGMPSCCTQSSREERQWTGPWLGAPNRVQP